MRTRSATLPAEELQPVFDYLQEQPFADPATGVGYVSPWLLGGNVNSIDPQSAVVPVREGAVLWIHYGAQWNDQAIGPEALQWVDGVADALDSIVSDTAWSGIPDLQFGSQLTDPPRFDYVASYWSSDTHDFVPFCSRSRTSTTPDSRRASRWRYRDDPQ